MTTTTTDTTAPLTFRGIEVTEANYSHALRHLAEYTRGTYGDLYLQIEHRYAGGGFARAAGYLLQIPAHLRSAAASEAHIVSNMSGVRYADALLNVVQDVKRGRLDFPYTAKNLEILAQERQAREDRLAASARQSRRTRETRCPDCGEAGERKGHMECQYPKD